MENCSTNVFYFLFNYVMFGKSITWLHIRSAWTITVNSVSERSADFMLSGLIQTDARQRINDLEKCKMSALIGSKDCTVMKFCCKGLEKSGKSRGNVSVEKCMNPVLSFQTSFLRLPLGGLYSCFNHAVVLYLVLRDCQMVLYSKVVSIAKSKHRTRLQICLDALHFCFSKAVVLKLLLGHDPDGPRLNGGPQNEPKTQPDYSLHFCFSKANPQTSPRICLL